MADNGQIHAVGRRKEAVCRIYLRPGSGKWDINGRTLGDYFPRPALVSAIQQPFTATDMLGRWDVAHPRVAGRRVRLARPPRGACAIVKWMRCIGASCVTRAAHATRAGRTQEAGRPKDGSGSSSARDSSEL
jgi:hypothetical protein